MHKNKLIKVWAEQGRPRDVESIAKILSSNGLDEQSIQQSFNAANVHYQPPQAQEEPEKEEIQEPEVSVPEWESVQVPVGFTVTSLSGKEFTWKGAQWVTKGKIVPKKYKDQITIAAKKKVLQSQKEADVEKANKQKEIDAEYLMEPETDQETAPETTPEPSNTTDTSPKPQDDVSSEDKIQAKLKNMMGDASNTTSTKDLGLGTASETDSVLPQLAKIIKNSPSNEKIVSLLAKNDKIADLAATILMSNAKDVVLNRLSDK